MAKSNKNNAAGAATEQINAVPEASKTNPEGSKMPPNASENGSVDSLRVEYRPLEALIPFARNARTHSDEQIGQIAASIREFGFTNPILLDGANGIIAGHGRIAAARMLALKTVPCIELGHLSEAQKRAYIIADNKIAQNGLWNEEFLRLELTELKEMGANSWQSSGMITRSRHSSSTFPMSRSGRVTSPISRSKSACGSQG